MENIENKVFEIRTEKSFGCLVIFLIFCCLLPVIAAVLMIINDMSSPVLKLLLSLLSIIVSIVLVIFCIRSLFSGISFGVYPTHIYHNGKYLWSDINQIIAFNRYHILCICLNKKSKMASITRFGIPEMSSKELNIFYNYTKTNENNLLVTFMTKKQFEESFNAVKYYTDFYDIPIIIPNEFM